MRRAARSGRSRAPSSSARPSVTPQGRGRDRACSPACSSDSASPATRVDFAEPGTDADPQSLCAHRHERAQFLLRRPYRRGAAGRPRGAGRVDPFAGAVAGRHALRPRRRRHEGRDRLLRRRRRALPRGARAGVRRLDQPAHHRRRGRRRRSTAPRSCSTGSRRAARSSTPASSASRPMRRQLGDMVKIGRRGSLTGYLTVDGRAGPYRLSASRRQRRASARRHAARADRRRRSTRAPSISRPRPCRSRRSISAIPPPTSFPARRAPPSTSASTTLDERDAERLAQAEARRGRRPLHLDIPGQRRSPSWCRPAK